MIEFNKYHGNGNDFIFISHEALNNFSNTEQLQNFVIKACHRNFGVGADGVVFYNKNHNRLLIMNSDGSFAETCGNALRCYGLMLLQKKLWDGVTLTQIKRLYFSACELPSNSQEGNNDDVIATLLEANLENKKISVAMGIETRVEIIKIPENIFHNVGFGSAFNLLNLSCVFVQLANPHLVFVSPNFNNFSEDQFKQFGKWAQSEFLNTFTGCIPVCNISMVTMPNEKSGVNDIRNLVVYERGAGLTLCCGSGAVASRVALESLGIIKEHDVKKEGVRFKLPGGLVDISSGVILSESQRILTGYAEHVFNGNIEWC